ncbi:HAMP domain-containing histidine kinase [Tessaracoccus sp. MC1865]|uniref:sensor histidine kinase n=1 Tax=Tessaracoccus sp. MC1865 TaxID=2760310 RepID=UPI0016049F5C|nr:HAMP domain-containing sensor histidine kinase [Tessaracoccus sp. MC1865]MBB1482773.1 HAMP domain-containing histidine kinase [Tessaracoccus sp. MC1865]QTO37781.1 HAMP domain-containing histidine kinase [Tessaracoccus sp. MC1865]
MRQGKGVLRSRLFLPWLALATVCALWMWFVPTFEVVPFHLVWVGFALAYGFEAWDLLPTVLAAVGVSLITGAILVYRASTGHVAWAETTEILLMLMLAGLVVWHVQRREAALTMAGALADRAAQSSARRLRLARLTSHEMRTPLTIAQSYVEMTLDGQEHTDVRERLEVVHDELRRLARASDRLLRMIQLSDLLERMPVDVDALLRETAHRWASVADRNWMVDSDAGTVTLSAERIRGCLDTLIENAVRYTHKDDTVRLAASTNAGSLWLGVADAGRGFDAALAAAVNARQPHIAHLPPVAGDLDLSQTGLGIALVQEIVESRGGRVLVGRSHEGGALVLLILPMDTGTAGTVGGAPATAELPDVVFDADKWATLSPDPMPAVRFSS